MRNMQTLHTVNGNNAQKVTTSVTVPAAAAALSAQCYAVRLYATTDTWVSFEGTINKTGATGLSLFIPAASPPQNYAVPSGGVITALADSTIGALHITELTS